MTHHAKAPSTRSTMRQATRLGRIVRGALAGRGASFGFGGSSAPSRRAKLTFAAGLALLTALALFVTLAGATTGHPFKETFGSAAQPTFSEPRELAVDQSNGDLLVMDAGSPPSIKRYKPDGTADNFSALGTNVIDGKKGTGGNACATEPSSCDETPQNELSFPSTSEAEIAVAPAGSAGGTAGDIYVTTRSPMSVTVFKPSGEYATQLTAANTTSFSEVCGVAVDSSGALYVGDYGNGVEKFVPSANPATNSSYTTTFIGAGTSVCKVAAGAGSSAGFLFAAHYSGELFKLDSSSGANEYEVSSGSTTTVSVDPTSGHVYAATGSEVKEYDASGASSATLVSSIARGSSVEGVAVDHSGHPWVSEGGDGASEYESTGSPPQPTGCTIGAGNSAIDLDAAGNVYLQHYGEIVKFTKTGACTYTQSTLDPNAQDVYADQSSPTGHIFTAQTGNFEEYDSSGARLGIDGAHYLSQYGARIAYNPTKDWVYVAQQYEPHPVVAVFGPPITGTAPEVTATTAALTGAEISTAHLAGEVNPENVPTEAHFEWKQSNESWASAAARQSSPPQTLTTNNIPQTVEFNTYSLRGNSTYQVRLVGVNSSNHLAGFSSSPVTITTKRAAEPPEATTSPVTTFGTTTATADGTVNPKGDTADWRLELQNACEGDFAPQRLESLAHSSTTPQTVSYGLTGLLPSERYCARLWAQNSAVGPEIQQLVVNAGGGEYTLSFEGETTAPIPYYAEAWQVESRLAALPSLGYSVSVRGGSGDVGGTHPYLIEFGGRHSEEDVPQLVATSINLSGGAATATVTTTHQGTPPTRSTPPQEFTTAPIPPAEAETAFAAPRLDTSARLNGRANPEGEVLTYRFEYSADGGATWKSVEGCKDGAGEPTAECTYSGEERQQIVVGEQLAGLSPGTTYSYRFAAENPADAGSPLQGAVKTFTTRTAAALTLPAPRGVELVNPPNKGTQNVEPFGQGLFPVGPNSPSGDRIFWSLASGAPGGNTASGDLYLSQRSGQSEAAPNGRETKSLIPPPSQQYGKGNFHYEPRGATPDLSRFFFKMGEYSKINSFIGEAFWVRIGAGGGGEEVLAAEPRGALASGVAEITEDGNHLVTLDENDQLVDHEAPGKETLLNVMPDGTDSVCGVKSPAGWPGTGGNNGGFGGANRLWREKTRPQGAAAVLSRPVPAAV